VCFSALALCVKERAFFKLCSEGGALNAWAAAYLFRAAASVRWPAKDGQPTQVPEPQPTACKARDP